MGYCVNYCPHTKYLCIVIECVYYWSEINHVWSCVQKSNYVFKNPIVFQKKHCFQRCAIFSLLKGKHIIAMTTEMMSSKNEVGLFY